MNTHAMYQMVADQQRSARQEVARDRMIRAARPQRTARPPFWVRLADAIYDRLHARPEATQASQPMLKPVTQPQTMSEAGC